MARKTIKQQPATRTRFQPRDLFLAGIGAVSLGRKQVSDAYGNGFDGIAGLRGRAQDALQSAAGAINGKVVALGKQAQAKAAPVRKQVVFLATEAKAQARSRLAPILARFGLQSATSERPASRKKPAATRRARKVA